MSAAAAAAAAADTSSRSPRAALYARVSTIAQAQRDLSVPEQLHRCREYAERRGWTVVAEYRDDGISGLTADRPAFQRMREDARNHEWDHLVIHSSDRLARAPDIAIGYEAALQRLGIEFHYVEEPDIPGHYGQLLHRIKQGFDEFFSYDLSEKTKRGQSARRKRGKPLISQPPFGYRREGDLFVPHTLEAAAITAAYDWLIEGVSWGEIGRRLDAMGVRPRKTQSWTRYPTVLPRILRNPIYAGLMTTAARYRRTAVGDHHYQVVPQLEWELIETTWAPALVPREKWARAQAVLSARAERKAGEQRYLLSGIFECPTCGGRMVGRTHLKRNRQGIADVTAYRYYVCRNRGVAHTQRNWRCEDVEGLVIAALDAAQADVEALNVEAIPADDTRAGVELIIAQARVAEIEEEIQQIYLMTERRIYDIDTAIQRRDQKLEELRGAQEQLRWLREAPAAPKIDWQPEITWLSGLLRDPEIPMLAKRQALATSLAAIRLVPAGTAADVGGDDGDDDDGDDDTDAEVEPESEPATDLEALEPDQAGEPGSLIVRFVFYTPPDSPHVTAAESGSSGRVEKWPARVGDLRRPGYGWRDGHVSAMHGAPPPPRGAGRRP